jgi:hypothetical protein
MGRMSRFLIKSDIIARSWIVKRAGDKAESEGLILRFMNDLSTVRRLGLLSGRL